MTWLSVPIGTSTEVDIVYGKADGQEKHVNVYELVESAVAEAMTAWATAPGGKIVCDIGDILICVYASCAGVWR